MAAGVKHVCSTTKSRTSFFLTSDPESRIICGPFLRRFVATVIYRSSYTMTVPCFYSVAVCWILVRFFGALTGGVNMC